MRDDRHYHLRDKVGLVSELRPAVDAHGATVSRPLIAGLGPAPRAA